MEKQKFEAMLILLVPQVVHLITENYHLLLAPQHAIAADRDLVVRNLHNQ